MKRNLKVPGALLVFSLLTVAQPILAKGNDCSQVQKNLVITAARAISLSSALSTSQKSVAVNAINAGNSSGGMGPRGRAINQANYLGQLDIDNRQLQANLAEAKAGIKSLLQDSCLASLSKQDVLEIAQTLGD